MEDEWFDSSGRSIDGEKVDPLSVPTDASGTLQGAALIAFEKSRDQIGVSRAAQGQ